MSLPRCACTSIRKAARAVSRVYDDALADAGMTITQFSILRHLSRAGDLPLTQLADLLIMDRTSLYRTLAPMTRHGWVRIDEAARGRTKIACLTPAGRSAMDAAADRWEAAQSRIVGAIGAEAWQVLEAGIDKMVDAARHAAPQE